MAMWAGRFAKKLDGRVNDYNESLSFDCRLYKWDITGSAAHAMMLAKQGIIKPEEAENILRGLKGILEDIENGSLRFDDGSEDIHMYVEGILTTRIGEDGKRLHTARSRNDQVALDTRLYLREQAGEIYNLVRDLINVITDKAEEHRETVMAGYTHLQRAQPVTYAHWLMAYASMFCRDLSRLKETYARIDVMPLGSGALAATTYPIEREYVANLLGFKEITLNSVDAVSDRDYAIELVFDISLIMMHLSRFAEEIILWSSSEYGFIELDDAYSTGSSIMPQKKNPDVAELARGKAGRAFGNLITLLTVMKGLPLAYNKDMQEDKEAVFDSIDNVKLTLEVFCEMYKSCTIRADKLRKSASLGFINATDCADYLVKKGMAFRDAYKTVGSIVAFCVKEQKPIEELPLETLKEYSDKFESDIYEALDLINCVGRRLVPGGPSKESVEIQIAAVKAAASKPSSSFVSEISEELAGVL
ncbi:MAG TPA: argininosuccinate lyase [Clostridiales bacterium]|jgi:argininosuccinate lyase|nr:argininosuccinate lyase [Clostridiales bacterium]